VVWAAAHVGHWDRLTGLLDEVEETLGPVEVLVDNAGTAPLFPSLEQVSEQLRDKVIDSNLKGPFRLMAMAGTWMIARGVG
jgi:NAD(P)-dependent dehydrogenase (short-subunit alcohol dehydrogenase family)